MTKHYFEVRYGPGCGSNTKEKLSSLWALLILVNTLNLRKIQIMGDSKVDIKWVNSKLQV
jgi:hypothetical protein